MTRTFLTYILAYCRLEGAAERDIFHHLWKNQAGIKTRIGVFATWTRTHVGSGIPSEDQVWRCWGAALVNNSSGRGKHLYIFDCDGDMEAIDFQAVRPRNIFIGAQQNLLEAVKKKFSLQSLWYLGCNECPNRSLASTGKWATSIANTPDASFHQDDPRFKGFKQVMRLA
ncbi:MAG: hypothetical protein L6R38_009460 [Xanthoria sp. 2 TBL-2021]|nr:MAG: hypothetical protein L6R38_009460 [Xanthoria sp. 2 TBL-2021]